MNIFTHDQCGGAVDINRKPVTCPKCGKIGYALMARADKQNIILWSEEEYRQELQRKIKNRPNGSGPHALPNKME